MENGLMKFKGAVAAFFTVVSAFLGWQGVMLMIWVACMMLDWISGVSCAVKTGTWDSAVAREGAWHKGGMIIVVMVAGLTDLVMLIICEHLPLDMTWPVLILPVVLAWYILTELGSILENAVKMGAPIPAWLIKLLKVGINVINRKGEELIVENAESQTVGDELKNIEIE